MRLFETEETFRIPPVPIKILDGEMVSTDGHTRMLAWLLHGHDDVECEWEDLEMDWEAYRICIQWCKKEGITSIHHLQDRIISPDEYQLLWLDRCRIMHEELEQQRGE